MLPSAAEQLPVSSESLTSLSCLWQPPVKLVLARHVLSLGRKLQSRACPSAHHCTLQTGTPLNREQFVCQHYCVHQGRSCMARRKMHTISACTCSAFWASLPRRCCPFVYCSSSPSGICKPCDCVISIHASVGPPQGFKAQVVQPSDVMLCQACLELHRGSKTCVQVFRKLC